MYENFEDKPLQPNVSSTSSAVNIFLVESNDVGKKVVGSSDL